MVESLELRRLLSTVILGSPGNDNIIISVENDNHIQVNFNGVIEVLNPPSDDNCDVSGFGGNDTIWLQNTSTVNFYITGHDGDDTYTIGNGQLKSDILRTVTVVDIEGPGQGGNDRLLVNDSLGDSSGTRLGIEAGQLRILNAANTPKIIYNLTNNDQITLQGSVHNDTYLIESLRQNFAVTTNDGADTIDFGGSQHRIDYTIPASVSFDGGFNINDSIILDDSNGSSNGMGISVGQLSVLGGIQTPNFEKMTIKTHNLAGNLAEPVTFSGFTCPAAYVTVLGSAGPDQINLGSQADPLDFAPLYLQDIELGLGSGINNVEINEDLSDAGHTWSFIGTELESNSAFTLRSLTTTTLLIRSSNGPDLFSISSIDPNWLVYIEGRGGNDVLSMVGADIDAAFTAYPLSFNGGSGSDEIILRDFSDQIGDVDGYTINGVGVSKGDFGSLQQLYVTYGQIDRLSLTCDADGNVIRLVDINNLPLMEIDGFNGDDTFTNVREGATGGQLLNSLPQSTILTGGAGNDTLALDDRFGSTGGYVISSTNFTLNQAGTRNVQFNSFERISVDGSDSANNIRVLSRSVNAVLAVNGAGGNDTLTVGGGDIDSNGFTPSSTTVTGGLGTDSVIFDDFLDNVLASETESYAFETLSLAKGSAGVSYAGFESQKLNCADGVANGTQFSTVNLNATNGSITNTTIQGGGSGRAVLVNVGNPFLFNIAGSVTTNGGAGGMTVNYNDAVGTGNRQYLVEPSEVYLTTNVLAHLFYSNLTTLNLNAGSGNDEILVEGVPAGTTVNVHGNNGNDLIAVGNFGSFITTILGNVNAFGDAGTDEVRWSSFDNQPITATLTTSAFTHLGRTYAYSTVESLWVNFFNTAALTLSVDSIALPTRVTGGSNGDSISVGGGNYANLTANVTINAGNGDDSVTIDDHLAVAGTYYILSAGDIFEPFVAIGVGYNVDSNDAEHFRIRNGSGNDTDQIDAPTLDVSIEAGGGDDFVNIKDSTLPVNVDTGSENGSGFFFPGDVLIVNSDADVGDTSASARIATNDRVYMLDVRSSGSSQGILRVGVNATVNVTNSLALTGGGTIDLAGGSLLLAAAATGLSATQLRAAIVSGRNGGAWNGSSTSGAINSSLASSTSKSDAVGYGSGSQIALTSLGGFPVAAGDTVVRYTLSGDTDLNQIVDFSDLLRLAQNYSLSGRAWVQGDFDYNTTADFSDLLSLAQSYGTSLVTSNVLRRRQNGSAAEVL